jgi:predicted acylesterase/phospholipase RssA
MLGYILDFVALRAIVFRDPLSPVTHALERLERNNTLPSDYANDLWLVVTTYALVAKFIRDDSNLGDDDLDKLNRFVGTIQAGDQLIDVDLQLAKDWSTLHHVGAGAITQFIAAAAYRRGLTVLGVPDPIYDANNVNVIALIDRPQKERGRFQILSLAGGGYRGLFTARVLEILEEELTRRRSDELLRDAFDVLAGTSIGGIIALGLAAGVPASTIKDAIQKNGEAIFTPVSHGWNGAQYNPGVLKKMVLSLLSSFAQERRKKPEELRLSDLEKTVFIIAFNVTTGLPEIFTNRRTDIGATDYALIDVALATSAAPIYFPVHQASHYWMIDGGIIANAPEAAAVAWACGYINIALNRIHTLAVGTTTESVASPSKDPDRGKLQLLKDLMDDGGLINTMMAGQENLARQMTNWLLDPPTVVIDQKQEPGHEKHLRLDNVSDESTELLLGLAQKAVEKTHQGDLKFFLNHQPSA